MRFDSRAALSDEMRHVCALMDGEISQWPDVTARSMFGFRAYYRSGVIFALFPQKRALETPESIAYKLQEGGRDGKKWISYETHGPEGVHATLVILEQAYRAAGQAKSRRKCAS
jgi:TfoX/Sxy family transcriptional regulator of competence genes